MLTELGEKSEPTKANNSTVAASLLQPPKMTELLPCPRCASTSTKFCYYNNYNLSQPRHFCKSCRRYWTQGGTLRNVPVGGGTRKNSKRSRSSPKSVAFSTSSSSTVSVESEQAESVSMPIPASTNGLSIVPETNPETFSHYTNLNLNENENFTSLLNAQGAELLGGYGSGYVAGFEEMSFGLNRAGVWPIQGMGYVGVGGGPAAGASGCNTWQLSDVGGGLTDGDFLGWPGLSISMPGKGSK